MRAKKFMRENSRRCLVAGFIIIGGCALDEAGLDPDESGTESVEQALGPPSNHYFKQAFGGNIFSTPFSYVTQENDPGGRCTDGYVRPNVPIVTWTSQSGGWCAFHHWNNPADTHDCRAFITGGTGGAWYGGQCETWVEERVDTNMGSFSFSAAATSSATVNTTSRSITLAANKTLSIGTCGVPDASFNGDTYLRLFDQTLVQIRDSDDACGGVGSQIIYTAPTSQILQIHVGCFSSSSCSGVVSWNIQ